MLVVIEPINKTGARGDRDPNPNHPYKDYRIHVLQSLADLPSGESVVHTVDGYDNWWTTIKNEEQVRKEAEGYAAKLGKRLGAKVLWSDKLPKTKQIEWKTIRAVVECRVPSHITEKSLVLALDRILQHPIQLGFAGNKETLVKPKFKQFSRVKAAEARS